MGRVRLCVRWIVNVMYGVASNKMIITAFGITPCVFLTHKKNNTVWASISVAICGNLGTIKGYIDEHAVKHYGL